MSDEGTPAALTVTIDGQVVEARPGELIIEAAERAGVFIPRFCYHPRMDSVGVCRMCLVEVSGPRGFSLQPACFLRVADGQEVRTSSEKARKAQEGVLEFLLVNHPLDCPVCDKGGECPLQDQALSHGPGESRFIEEKRHWEKPIEIGPLVYLDRERCIQCSRCTRFAAEIAGEALIDFAFRGDRVEVATFPTEPFGSYFSGNTVQICPVGALTAPPYRFKSRPWDLEQVETTCTTCAVGCRVVAQSSAGELVRYLGVDADPVNQSWLCDRGRYGFEAIYAQNRLREPLLRRGEDLVPASWHEALGEVVAGVRQARDRGGAEAVGIIGGARLANEDAYAWAKLAKAVIGTDSVDAQLGDGLPAQTVLGLPRATFDDLGRASAIVLLAPDLREELPVAFLRVRDAAVRGHVPILECAPVETALSGYAAARLAYLPGEAARLVAALVAPGEGGGAGEVSGVDPAALAEARAVLAAARRAGERAAGDGVVVVLGRPSVADGEQTVAAAAAILHDALPGARFLSALRRANVHGALDMGLAPGVLPGRVGLEQGREWYSEVWGSVPASAGRDAEAILRAAAAGELEMLVLLGADPIADFPDRALATAALSTVPFVVAVGTHADASSDLAHVVLPVAGDGERGGTTTNCEGRVSRLAPKVAAPGVAWPAWIVASEIARRLGLGLGLDGAEAIAEEIARVVPSHRGLSPAALRADSARDGVVVPLGATPVTIGAAPRRLDPIATPGIASVEEQGAPLRVGFSPTPAMPGALSETPVPPLLGAPGPEEVLAPPRLDAYSHRLVVRRHLYDRGTLVAASTSLKPLAPDEELVVHPAELARLGVASGEQLRVRSPHGDAIVTARADERTPRSVVVLGANLASQSAPGVLIAAGSLATDVRLETI